MESEGMDNDGKETRMPYFHKLLIASPIGFVFMGAGAFVMSRRLGVRDVRYLAYGLKGAFWSAANVSIEEATAIVRGGKYDDLNPYVSGAVIGGLFQGNPRTRPLGALLSAIAFSTVLGYAASHPYGGRRF